MGQRDDAANFVRAALAVLVRTEGGKATPALRWLAPRVALGLAQRGLARALDRWESRVEACIASVALVDRAASRDRVALLSLRQTLRDLAKSARVGVTESGMALGDWESPVRELAILVARARGAPCFSCGLVFRSSADVARHTCSKKTGNDNVQSTGSVE